MLALVESGTLVFTGWKETDGEMRVDSGSDAEAIESVRTRHNRKKNINILFMVHEIFSSIINAPLFRGVYYLSGQYGEVNLS
jgi:hypothetical protein